jgi:hypothetical protein
MWQKQLIPVCTEGRARIKANDKHFFITDRKLKCSQQGLSISVYFLFTFAPFPWSILVFYGIKLGYRNRSTMYNIVPLGNKGSIYSSSPDTS